MQDPTHDYKTVAGQFYNEFPEETREDIEHDAWTEAIAEFKHEHPDWYDRIEATNQVQWADMRLEPRHDDNNAIYFGIVTGVHYAPGHTNGKELFEMVVELLDNYRDAVKRKATRQSTFGSAQQ